MRARINAARRATWVAPLALAGSLIGVAQEHVSAMVRRWTLICGVPLAESDPQHVQQLLHLLNLERQRAGVPILTLSDPLIRAAQAHASDMSQRGYFNFAHVDGTGFESQLKAVGFPGAAIPAIAKGHSTADAALDQWLRSEGNRKNLLDQRYRLLGVGVAASHWTVILGVTS